MHACVDSVMLWSSQPCAILLSHFIILLDIFEISSVIFRHALQWLNHFCNFVGHSWNFVSPFLWFPWSFMIFHQPFFYFVRHSRDFTQPSLVFTQSFLSSLTSSWIIFFSSVGCTQTRGWRGGVPVAAWWSGNYGRRIGSKRQPQLWVFVTPMTVVKLWAGPTLD
jgi:hypothetical protein